MLRRRGERKANGQGIETRTRKRGEVSDSNQAFLDAFADALRDILREERRPAA
jgi:hypothetical protein